MYVMSAQYCDAEDLKKYLAPIIVVTSLASVCGFAAGSAYVSMDEDLNNWVSLASGLLGVLATTITAVRNTVKFDVKAEMFRGAAGQYRLLATRLEARMREHRMQMMHESWSDPAVRRREIDTFNTFFTENYKVILTSQAEMKYFPPGAAVGSHGGAERTRVRASARKSGPLQAARGAALPVASWIGVSASRVSLR